MNAIYIIVWFLIYIIRTFVLWILIPYSFVAWALVHRWAHKATLGQSICWHDQNFLSFMVLVPFRFLRFINPELAKARFLTFSEMAELKTYKISFLSEMS